MKKTFLKLLLLGVFTLSAQIAFVSCNDYDKDIERIDQTDKDLTNQLSVLQQSLSATQSEVEAAKKAAAEAKADAVNAQTSGDAAAKAAAEAKAEAELAKEAAAQAKTDAIEAAIKEVHRLMENTASKDDIKALGSKIEGIEKGLNTITTEIDNLKKFQEAVNVQITALENFQKLVETELAGIKGNMETMAQEISTIKNDLAYLKNNMATIANIEEAVNKACLDVQNKLGGEINTLIGILMNRLTSVTLIPSVYIGGIPSIDFRSVEYTPKKFDASSGKAVNIPSAKTVLVSNGKTSAKYRVNPVGVTSDDIKLPSFVSNIAEVRSSSENTPIKVDSYTVNSEGEMTVFASKTVTTSLNLADNKIYTVSLKVPVADKNLLNGEKTTDAVVYSEYVRLSESTFTPQIASLPYTCTTPVNHYNDSIDIYKSAENTAINTSVNYAKSIDLNEMVTGCYTINNKHIEIDKDDLKTYGLEFKFAVAKGSYILGSTNTNQQEFAKVSSDGILTSKLPGGETNNKAAVGKQPIIRVSLLDTKNKNLVDQKYIKVKFTEEAQPPVNLGEIAAWTRDLTCSGITPIEFSWVQMTDLVYAKLNSGKGMSKEEFAKIYTNFSFSGNGTATNFADSPNAGTNAITWGFTEEQIGSIAPNTEKDYTVNIVYSDPKGLFGDVTFSFKLKVNIIKPSLVGYYEQYWSAPGTVYRITPVHYDPATMGTGAISARCKYYNNLMNGFKYINNIPLKDMLPCGTWDIQFSKTGQTPGFTTGYTGSEPDKSTTSNIGGYKLFKGTVSGNPAAYLEWENGHTAWCVDHIKPTVILDKNNGGKDLIGKKSKMSVWAKVNNYNFFEITRYDIEFIAPLHINANIENGEFEDGVYSGSVVSCSKAFTMTDFNNYIVAKVTTNNSDEKKKYASELYQYYEVQDPNWDLVNAKIGMKYSGGSLVVDDALTADNSVKLTEAYANASITLSPAGDLVFKNNSGSKVEKACNIFIKATVTYGWGKSEEWVKIRLVPAK